MSEEECMARGIAERAKGETSKNEEVRVHEHLSEGYR